MRTCPKCSSIFRDEPDRCEFCGYRFPKPTKAPEPPEDDPAFASVVAEITAGTINKVTWARAFADSGGSPDATKALYVRYRAEQFRAATRNNRT